MLNLTSRKYIVKIHGYDRELAHILHTASQSTHTASQSTIILRRMWNSNRRGREGIVFYGKPATKAISWQAATEEKDQQ